MPMFIVIVYCALVHANNDDLGPKNAMAHGSVNVRGAEMHVATHFRQATLVSMIHYNSKYKIPLKLILQLYLFIYSNLLALTRE